MVGYMFRALNNVTIVSKFYFQTCQSRSVIDMTSPCRLTGHAERYYRVRVKGCSKVTVHPINTPIAAF